MAAERPVAELAGELIIPPFEAEADRPIGTQISRCGGGVRPGTPGRFYAAITRSFSGF